MPSMSSPPSATTVSCDRPTDPVGHRRLHPGTVADEQMSALAMAVLLNGMNRREIATWTAAMIASGDRMDFSGLSRPTADKHSTGGVGDKITLPLAPLVAVFGVAVPQLSGRGSATPAARSTSWSPWRAGGPTCRTRPCSRSSRRSAPSSAPPAPGSPRRQETLRCCAMSLAPSRLSR